MLSVSVGAIVSIVSALLRHRGRVDLILARSETTDGLPFKLPKAAARKKPFIPDMIAFFQTEHGQAVLALQGLVDDFKQVLSAREEGNYPQQKLTNCMDLYFEAAQLDPAKTNPNSQDSERRKIASTGPDEEFRLAYYVVESQRLSRNPVLARLVLATADTLLETIAGNSSLFIKDEVTAKIVDAAINAFAVQHDFDDEGAEIIFRRLLGVVAVSVAREGNAVSDNPAVRALFGAVREAQEVIGADDAAKIVSAKGLQTTVQKLLATVATDPSFLTEDKALQSSITAVMTKASEQLPDIVDGKETAILALVEALVSEAAKHASILLKVEHEGTPLTETVLSAMLTSLKDTADTNALFTSIASGEIIGALYKAALSAVAANPDAIQNQIGVTEHVATLVTRYAEALAAVDPAQFNNVATVRATVSRILSITLQSLSEHPGLAERTDEFGPRMVSAMLDAASGLVSDGIQQKDLTTFVDICVAAASENVALLNIGDHFNSVVKIWAAAIASEGVRALTSPETRLRILRNGVLETVRNPVLWEQLNQGQRAESLVVEIVGALVTQDQAPLLSGPVLADAIKMVLEVVVRRVNPEDLLPEGQLRQALVSALAAASANGTLSAGVDDVAGYLANFVQRVLKDPTILNSPASLANNLRDALEDQLKMAA